MRLGKKGFMMMQPSTAFWIGLIIAAVAIFGIYYLTSGGKILFFS